MIDKITEKIDVAKKATEGIKIDEKKAGSIGTDVALIALCVIAAFVSFWDVSITFASAFAIGWVSVFLYIVTTTVYRTKYDGGIYKGRETEAYKQAKEAFSKKRESVVKNSMTDELRDWCNDYRKKELESLRKDIVCPYMTYEEYLEKYANMGKEDIKALPLSHQIKRAIHRANRIEPVELRADMLLNASENINLFGKRRALPMSGGEKRGLDFLNSYISKFIITFLCGMFVIDILSDPSLEMFLQWVVRMFPVVTAFLTGDTNGYRNAVEVDTNRLVAQEKMLTLFFLDKGVKEDEETGREESTENNVGEAD